eukprot:m.79427 g.79427  ORF g.79427 m.79427 type:complete len:147 (-) comp25214_c0_seq1:85-525(-)
MVWSATMDEFDELLNLEESFTKIGTTQGHIDGTKEGELVGFASGLKAGQDAGVELGHYYGAAKMWQQPEATRKFNIRNSTQRAIIKLMNVISRAIELDPASDEFYELWMKSRKTYKLILVNLKITDNLVPEVYETETNRDDAELDF